MPTANATTESAALAWQNRGLVVTDHARRSGPGTVGISDDARARGWWRLPACFARHTGPALTYRKWPAMQVSLPHVLRALCLASSRASARSSLSPSPG